MEQEKKYPVYKTTKKEYDTKIKGVLDGLKYDTTYVSDDFEQRPYIVLDFCGEFGTVKTLSSLHTAREKDRYEVDSVEEFLKIASKLKSADYNEIKANSGENITLSVPSVPGIEANVYSDNKKDKTITEHADRYNIGKTRYSLSPDYALNQMAKVMTFGAKKYADDNWRKGLSFTSCLDSLERHIAKFKIGQDYDEETGLHHLAHAMANCSFIMEYSLTHPELDDRQHQYLHIPKIGLDIDDVIADFCGAYCEKFKVPTPKFWNFDYNIKNRLSGDDLNDFYLSLKPKFNPDDLKFEPTCYITSRPVPTEITQKWIEANGFPCVPIYTVDMNHPKVKVAKESGIDLFIDDKFDNFVELNNNGVCTFLMDMPHNKRFNVGYKRIKDINEVINRFNSI